MVVALVAVIAIVAIASVFAFGQDDGDEWREIPVTEMPPFTDGTYHYKGEYEGRYPEQGIDHASEVDITFEGGYITELDVLNMTVRFTDNLPDVVYVKDGVRFTQVSGHSWDTTVYRCDAYEFTIANGLPVHVVCHGKYMDIDLVMSDWFY